jgi:hypothetical protein
VDFVQVERDRRKALKIERDTLFARYLTQPRNTRLVVAIKAIDHEIAKSVEDSSSQRQRTSLGTRKQGGTRAESQSDPG